MYLLVFLFFVFVAQNVFCYDYTLYVSPDGSNKTYANCSDPSLPCTFPQAVDIYTGICFSTDVQVVFSEGTYNGDSWMTEKEPKLYLFVFGGSLTLSSSENAVIQWTKNGEFPNVLIEISFKYYEGRIGDFIWDGIDVNNSSPIGPLFNIFNPFGTHPNTATFRNFKSYPIVSDLGGGFVQGADGEGCDKEFAVMFDNAQISSYEQSFWTCPAGNEIIIQNSVIETCEPNFISSVDWLKLYIKNSKILSGPKGICDWKLSQSYKNDDVLGVDNSTISGGLQISMLDNGPSSQSDYQVSIQNTIFSGVPLELDLDSYYNPAMPTRSFHVNLTQVSFTSGSRSVSATGYYYNIKIKKQKERYYKDVVISLNEVLFDNGEVKSAIEVVGNSAGRARIEVRKCSFAKGIQNLAEYLFDPTQAIETNIFIEDTKILTEMGIVLGFQ